MIIKSTFHWTLHRYMTLFVQGNMKDFVYFFDNVNINDL